MMSPEEWGDAYAELRSSYVAFAERLESLLLQLFEDEGLSYRETFTWSWNVDDLVAEMYRLAREGVPGNALPRTAGVAGVTVVTYTKHEAKDIYALVERELDVDRESSLSFEAAEALRERPSLGDWHRTHAYYESPHLRVSIDEGRRELPEWSRFADLRLRVVVKTFLQNTWHWIDDDMQPNVWETSVPEAVREVIRKAADRIREADDELSRIAELTDEIETEYAHSVMLGKPPGVLDLVALQVYVQDSETVRRLVAKAESAGMLHDTDAAWASELDLWVLRQCGFDSVRELDAFLERSEPRATDVYGRLVDTARRDESELTLWATPVDVVYWLVLVLTRADTDIVALSAAGPPIRDALNALIGNPVER